MYPLGKKEMFDMVQQGDTLMVALHLPTFIREYEINVTNIDGHNLLICACMKGHAAVVELLIGHGADVCYKGLAYIAPLHIAIINRHIDVVKILLQYPVTLNFGYMLRLVKHHSSSEIKDLIEKAILTNSLLTVN